MQNSSAYCAMDSKCLCGQKQPYPGCTAVAGEKRSQLLQTTSAASRRPVPKRERPNAWEWLGPNDKPPAAPSNQVVAFPQSDWGVSRYRLHVI